ncbi:MAG: TIGR02466 family protein [Gammaproteobacteria bacterium]
MQERLLFYTPLWQDCLATLDADDWAHHREHMLARVYALERDGNGIERSNFGGWQSDDQIYRFPEFGWLLGHIMRLSNDIAPAYAPGLRFNNGQIWANINRRGAFNAPHTHPNSLLSGVVYLKVSGAEQGVIEFFDTREGSPPNHWGCFLALETPTELTRDTHVVTPHEGLILFFPSWMRHWVRPNVTDEDRVTLAFNVRAT